MENLAEICPSAWITWFIQKVCQHTQSFSVLTPVFICLVSKLWRVVFLYPLFFSDIFLSVCYHPDFLREMPLGVFGKCIPLAFFLEFHPTQTSKEFSDIPNFSISGTSMPNPLPFFKKILVPPKATCKGRSLILLVTISTFPF